ncbi:MAG TPA: AAA family ATPase [Streptosporangiaceae bacterium]|nr:AAA family ATPase [Streptosporangiaceae bacterium]
MERISRGRRVDLPAELTSFVGREREVAAVEGLLGQSRLVTLTGPGGVGKTRIALRVAARLRNSYADGVCLVELSALQDPRLLSHTVVAALGLPEQTARPSVDVLVEYLRDKRLLLILDTCEHLVDSCAMFVDVLLRGAGELQVLATGRQPLNSIGEYTLSITPLPVPESDEEPFGENYDALVLFAERAAAVVPGFAVTEDNWAEVAAACRRLDGIPLAIELAVVRLRALSLEQMVSLLEDRFRLLTSGPCTALPRHQTLRTAIGWSHELCAPEERLLWARLSVFAGDFDLTAVQRICASGDLAAEDIPCCLADLVDKSIVTRVESDLGTRYRLLDTIRDYGREWLVAVGEENEYRARHRDFYCAMAQQFDAEWVGSAQISWVKRLNAERPNLRVALEYCLTEPDEAMTGLTMATRLWGYWLCSTRLSEGRYWMEQGLHRLREPTPVRAQALWLTGWFAIMQGEPPVGEPLFEEARAIAEQIGDDAALAYAIQYLGCVYMFRGEAKRGLPMCEEAVAGLRKLEDRPGLMIVLLQLALCYVLNGDIDRALAACDESLRLNGDNDERWYRGYALYTKGLAYWVRGDYSKSTEMASAGLTMKHELGDLQGMAHCMEVLCWVAAQEGHYHRAAWLMGAADVLWHKIGLPLFGMEIMGGYHDAAEQRARQALGEDDYAETFGAGARLTLEQAVRQATAPSQ